MNFRTEIQIPPGEFQISHSSRILCLGSCFADRMGARLEAAKFPVSVNPPGIVYNPLSLLKLLAFAQKNELPDLQYAEHLGLWHSFDLHTSMSNPDREEMQVSLRQVFEAMRLDRVDCLILTFGTGNVYRRKDTGEIVANCHRYPGSFFTKTLLQPNEMWEPWKLFLDGIREQWSELRVLLTVSPVRHVKDGLSLNAASKASLRLLCHHLASVFQAVEYFPAYEIMTDDLRDYRFYGDDLIHPTNFAEDYIWEKFQQTYFSEETQQLVSEWMRIRSSLNHYPRQKQSDEHRRFLFHILEQLVKIQKKLPCEGEIEAVRKQLAGFG